MQPGGAAGEEWELRGKCRWPSHLSPLKWTGRKAVKWH